MHTYWFTPTVTITINDSDFNLLMETMGNHYDSTVEAATKRGGFMYGEKNRREWDATYKDVELTNIQLQLLTKSLEMHTSEECLKLRSNLWKILKEMGDVTKRVNIQHESENLVSMLNSLSSGELSMEDFESHINSLIESPFYEEHNNDVFKGILELSREMIEKKNEKSSN